MVPRFYSPVPHPEALAVDALSRDWPRDALLYAFPPTALVQALLQKLRQEPGLRLILVAPTSSTKPWYANLRDLVLQARCGRSRRGRRVVSITRTRSCTGWERG